jgi:hypothetical protein
MKPTTKPCLIRTAPHDHDYNQNKCGLPERYPVRPWLPTAQQDPRKWPKNFALAIDTECTGLDPFHPLEGMEGEKFLHAARPFLVCAFCIFFYTVQVRALYPETDYSLPDNWFWVCIAIFSS